jgi:hypothetical protein
MVVTKYYNKNTYCSYSIKGGDNLTLVYHRSANKQNIIELNDMPLLNYILQLF